LTAEDGSPEDSFDQWATDIEAECQSPENDMELLLEDAEAAGITPGTMRVGLLPVRTSLHELLLIGK